MLRERGARVSAHDCCPPHGEGRATTLRRGLWSSTCLLPAALVALAPKCPACLAAYLTLASGVGITATAAEHVRTGGAGLAGVGVIFFASRYFGRRTKPEADPVRQSLARDAVSHPLRETSERCSERH